MQTDELKYIIKSQHADLYQWALRCCNGQESDAVDVLQIVYLKVLEGKATFKKQSNPKTWLFSVIRNTAIDFYRKKNRYFITNEVPERPVEVSTDIENHHYQQLLQQLSPKQSQLLTLVFYHHMTIEEASKVMKISIGTARTHYSRGKQHLKALILQAQANER